LSSAAPRRRRAILDTSFWVAAYRAEVAANCLDLFEIIVPRAVEAEIRALQTENPQREYPHATLFRQLRSQMGDPPSPGTAPLGILGAGEAEAIALAVDLGVAVLINEGRGARYAAKRGIVVVTVPSMVVLLRAQDVISARAARRKLDLIASITPRFMIAGALHALGVIERLEETR